MPMVKETSTRNIIARLERKGRELVHGGSHEKFEYASYASMTLIVLRHREVSPGLARDIAKKAGRT